MKNVRILLLLSVLLALVFTAFRLRPADERKREVREVPAFAAVELAGAARVVLVQGSPQRVEVEGTAEELARFETNVQDGRLRLASRPQNGRSYSEKTDTRLTVYVTAPVVNALTLTGSGDIVAEGPLKTEALALAISGSGNMRLLQLMASSLSTAVSGSGNVVLAGSSPRQVLTLSGSGNVRARDLRTETTDVTVSGSGNVVVTATVSAHASVRGSGNVSVAGGARLTSEIKGSGRVKAE